MGGWQALLPPRGATWATSFSATLHCNPSCWETRLKVEQFFSLHNFRCSCLTHRASLDTSGQGAPLPTFTDTTYPYTCPFVFNHQKHRIFYPVCTTVGLSTAVTSLISPKSTNFVFPPFWDPFGPLCPLSQTPHTHTHVPLSSTTRNVEFLQL